MDLGPSLPGETPLDDVLGLRHKGIKTRADLNKVEAENIRRAIVKYLAAKPSRRTAKFDLAWSKKLHKEMFGTVWSWAGQVRTTNLNIGVPHAQVETTLHTLMDDLPVWEEHKLDILEQAVMLHHRAVQIHPFLNGNGRWARLMANV